VFIGVRRGCIFCGLWGRAYAFINGVSGIGDGEGEGEGLWVVVMKLMDCLLLMVGHSV
jgi:hypothetical protein